MRISRIAIFHLQKEIAEQKAKITQLQEEISTMETKLQASMAKYDEDLKAAEVTLKNTVKEWSDKLDTAKTDMAKEQERFKQELSKQDAMAKELMQSTVKEMNERFEAAKQKENALAGMSDADFYHGYNFQRLWQETFSTVLTACGLPL